MAKHSPKTSLLVSYLQKKYITIPYGKYEKTLLDLAEDSQGFSLEEEKKNSKLTAPTAAKVFPFREAEKEFSLLLARQRRRFRKRRRKPSAPRIVAITPSSHDYRVNVVPTFFFRTRRCAANV